MVKILTLTPIDAQRLAVLPGVCSGARLPAASVHWFILMEAESIRYVFEQQALVPWGPGPSVLIPGAFQVHSPKKPLLVATLSPVKTTGCSPDHLHDEVCGDSDSGPGREADTLPA